ncbi:cyanophycinase [Dethiobacter alkaliphilus]|uniref:cyanophycinase n=1 Tax=Dethiobacter alkaliphilus TaxID=427926 RepID=UPI002226BA30|nr:cyanophycinase [Dethiobacter alkaliphilus]MCW3489116.1 cyanophycinase [Dethiobacter alkaliphilus]
MEQAAGELVIIGGAEDKDGECEILQRFFSLAKGREARLLVLSTASTDPDAGEQYRQIFSDLGAAEVRVLAVQSRQKANSPEYARIFAECTGIFFTGGDQLRITGILGGSLLGEALFKAHRDGVVIAGTSAGASVMSETMLVGGANDATPKKEIIRMAPGLGFLKGAVIDQHFAQRGRIGRLLAAVAHNPFILGIGLDEDTAIIYKPVGEYEVVGSGSVTLIDGREVACSNVSESTAEEPLVLTNVRLHILSRNYAFKITGRQIRISPLKEDT